VIFEDLEQIVALLVPHTGGAAIRPAPAEPRVGADLLDDSVVVGGG
jgi:hypothetical protein